MNLKDEEWEPEPTDPLLLRKVRAIANSTASTHDLSNLRAALLAPPFHGAIPHELRGAVWLLLLRLRVEALLAEDAPTFAQAARESVADANAREQIEKDVQRTRPGLARFKQPAVRGALLRLLSLFCERKRVAYVQGFNELLAPFVLITDTGGNPRLVYALFSEFVARFAPWMLETSETRVFDVLKRLFKYFGRLLLYHDPELYWLLERHMMTPDLYATSWFVTLFARNFTVESVLALWDLLLLEDNPLGTSFFGIALLCSKREELLSVDESRIPETLMMLTASSPADVRRLWKIGSRMRKSNTPPSFQRLMMDRLLHAPGKQTRVGLSAAKAMQASVCLQTTPEDLVASEAHYFTWDCRTLEEYNAGHLAQAAHLSLNALREANGDISGETNEAARLELQAAVDLCEPLKESSHICLVGTGVKEEDNMDINMLGLYLTRIGIPYVSTLRGGFKEALAAAGNDDSLCGVELVDYDQRKFDRARKSRIAAQNRRRREAERRGVAAANSDKEERSSRRFRYGRPYESNGSDTSPFSSAELVDTPREEQNKSSSSFLEKTDAEVSRVLNIALSGIGLKGTLSAITSGFSTEREPQLENFQCPTVPAPSYNPFSPNANPSPSGSMDSYAADASPAARTSPRVWRRDEAGSSRQALTEPRLQRSISSLNNPTGKWASGPGRRSGIVTAENSPRLIDTPSYAMSPRPGVQVNPNEVPTESPIRQRNTSGTSSFFGGNKNPWGRDAKPGWLSDESLAFDIASMPKGFSVNVMDDRVMAGLRLFPCKARSDRSAGLRGRTNEFKKRYVGVSANYFLLLSPHHNRHHLLEVKVIRYLQDISRITFKRSRPELVTFEVVSGEGESITPESIVCIMPDGLKECVALIKQYLAAVGVDDATDSPALKQNHGKSGENINQRSGSISNEPCPISAANLNKSSSENAPTQDSSAHEPLKAGSEENPSSSRRSFNETTASRKVGMPAPPPNIPDLEFGEFQSAQPSNNYDNCKQFSEKPRGASHSS